MVALFLRPSTRAAAAAPLPKHDLLYTSLARAEEVLGPVFNELTFNLESFNPAFTSCLLMVSE